MKLVCTHCKGSGVIGMDELSSDQRRLLTAVQTAARRGITTDNLIAEVYRERASSKSQHSLRMLIRRLNHHLLNARVVADRKGRGARFHLIEDAKPQRRRESCQRPEVQR